MCVVCLHVSRGECHTQFDDAFIKMCVCVHIRDGRLVTIQKCVVMSTQSSRRSHDSELMSAVVTYPQYHLREDGESSHISTLTSLVCITFQEKTKIDKVNIIVTQFKIRKEVTA